MEAGHCLWSRLGELGEGGETGCQPARTRERRSEGQASEGGSTHDGWIQIGTHTRARRILCQGGQDWASSGPRDGRPAIGGRGEGRGGEGDIDRQRGMGSGEHLELFSRGAHGVMQTHGQPPRPRLHSTL